MTYLVYEEYDKTTCSLENLLFNDKSMTFDRLNFISNDISVVSISQRILTRNVSENPLKCPGTKRSFLVYQLIFFIANVNTLSSSRIRVDIIRNSSMRTSKLQVHVSARIKPCTRREWQRLTRIPSHCHF